LQECDICVHCNPPTEWFRAAQPLKVCEYLALRKPTVAWDYPGARHLLDNGRLGILVPSGNKSAFTDALIHLVNPFERCTIEHEINVAIQGEWSSGYWYEEVLKRVKFSVLKKYEVKRDKSN
jgi:glycosyltransferase involved in cell wall biosynthesis